MAEERKSINIRDRRTRMAPLLWLLIDTYFPLKILEVAQGIEYIHSVGTVHGDLRGVFYLIHAT